MVAAERQRLAAVPDDIAVGIGDDVDAFRQVERVDRHIADIGHLQAVEGRGARRHVVGADHAALGADLARPEARARPVRGADIHGDADEAGVEPFRRQLRRQAHHGGGAAEARHLVAAERLVERLGRHLSSSGGAACFCRLPHPEHHFTKLARAPGIPLFDYSPAGRESGRHRRIVHHPAPIRCRILATSRHSARCGRRPARRRPGCRRGRACRRAPRSCGPSP
jgi:hypothetical protein